MKNAELKTRWLIGICNSDADGVVVYAVLGTKNEVKKHLVNLVKEDKREDSERFDSGTTALKDVYEESNGTLSAYATYYDYHIDYVATPDDLTYDLDEKGNTKEEI